MDTAVGDSAVEDLYGRGASCSMLTFLDHSSRAELADTPNQYEMRYIWGLHSLDVSMC